MSLFDLLSLIFENLSRRKGRVALTAIGVIIGTAAVVLLVSLGVGLQENAASQLGGIGDLTKINVYPQYGEPDPDTGIPSSMSPITDETIAQISGMPGVSAVAPLGYFNGWGYLTLGRKQGGGQFTGIGTDDLSNIGLRPQSGSLALERGTIVVGSAVPQQFWDPFACLQLTFIPGLTYSGGTRAQIEGVRVDTELRGAGIGRALIEHAVSISREKPCVLVQLTTDKRRDEAQAFYQTLGFTASHEGMKLRF
jgi:ribosomal protein S18 acetylase RimI-like enzyme